MHRVLALPR